MLGGARLRGLQWGGAAQRQEDGGEGPGQRVWEHASGSAVQHAGERGRGNSKAAKGNRKRRGADRCGAGRWRGRSYGACECFVAVCCLRRCVLMRMCMPVLLLRCRGTRVLRMGAWGWSHGDESVLHACCLNVQLWSQVRSAVGTTPC